MTIAKVQLASFTGAWTGSLGANGTPGNSIFLGEFAYNAVTANTMSSNSPLYNGAAVAGATKILEVQSPSGQAVYAAIWMLPNIQSAGKTLGLTGVNTTIDSNVGLAAIEVSGLGSAPLVGSAGGAGAASNPQTATGTSTSPSSGASGAISSQPQLVLGASVGFGQDQTAPSSPWLTIGQPSSGPLDVFSYQIVTSSGGTFTFAPTGHSSADWVAGVVTVAPTGGGPAPIPPDLLMACFP